MKKLLSNHQILFSLGLLISVCSFGTEILWVKVTIVPLSILLMLISVILSIVDMIKKKK
jgi:hypothetical protein